MSIGDTWQAEQLNDFFQAALSGLDCGAIATPDGRLLNLKYQSLVDIGTLPFACQEVNKYLQLKDGDMAIVNDPGSGGTILSAITLVQGVSLNSKNSDIDVLMAMRFFTKPHVSLAKTIDEEGLRIPPTPIFAADRINEVTFNAITEHPGAPKELKMRLEGAIHSFNELRKKMQTEQSTLDISINKTSIKTYLAHSKKLMSRCLTNFPVGEIQTTEKLNRNCDVHIHLTSNDGLITIDFTGTGNNETIFLTNPATLGIVFGALLALIGEPIPINSGTLQAVSIHTPANCFLNANYPSPTIKGMTEGASLLADTILKAFGKISHRWMIADSGSSQCPLEIQFSTGQYFYDTIGSGSAAQSERNGIDGANFWMRTGLQPSMEEVENRFPLVIKSFMIKPGSGGAGNFVGGSGLVKTYQVKEKATLIWNFEQTDKIPQGAFNGKNGSLAEIYWTKPDGSREKLGAQGKLELEADDLLTIHSPGGGGYAK